MTAVKKKPNKIDATCGRKRRRMDTNIHGVESGVCFLAYIVNIWHALRESGCNEGLSCRLWV